MPTYPYECKTCGAVTEVVRHMRDAGEPVSCPACFENMSRIWTVPAAKVAESGYYDYGLGRYIGSTHDKREAFRELRDDKEVKVKRKNMETGEIYHEKVVHQGVDLVEVGNERKAMHSVSPKRRAYGVPGEMGALVK